MESTVRSLSNDSEDALAYATLGYVSGTFSSRPIFNRKLEAAENKFRALATFEVTERGNTYTVVCNETDMKMSTPVLDEVPWLAELLTKDVVVIQIKRHTGQGWEIVENPTMYVLQRLFDTYIILGYNEDKKMFYCIKK